MVSRYREKMLDGTRKLVRIIEVRVIESLLYYTIAVTMFSRKLATD